MEITVLPVVAILPAMLILHQHMVKATMVPYALSAHMWMNLVTPWHTNWVMRLTFTILLKMAVQSQTVVQVGTDAVTLGHTLRVSVVPQVVPAEQLLTTLDITT